MTDVSQAEKLRMQTTFDAWRALPEVEELYEQVEAFAWRHNLKFDVEGSNAVLEFITAYHKEHHVPSADDVG